jgi:glucan phosphoethanolaminetransferase (alkaline phosphatase superfamily)
MITKNKASILLLIIFSIFSQSFLYQSLPWFNIKTGIILSILAFISMAIVVLKLEKNSKLIYTMIGITMLLLLIQFII